mmetsp:Transcript_31829/g.46939  ORF Transcript_31829/g.46939 Transcript_31829/m.46939 type:complete len:284 (-) Transcript_31829:1133-1984(-)
MGDRPTGPFGIDPIHFSFVLFGLLVLFVLYLLLPRGLRVQYFKAYPKRYAWSARSRARRNGRSILQPSVAGSGAASSIATGAHQRQLQGGSAGAAYSATGTPRNAGDQGVFAQQQQLLDLQQNDEIVISAAMQQLRDPGVLIIAHGSRGKPKTVRLQLTESAITWRTETRKKGLEAKPKMGKLHQVPLSHIMYVDVGKQTTALRRVENASVSEALCFSLLTKEGSLDLEANSPRERDALVSCFSLVLDEVHAQNWRDIYRGPSSDMPSSFDDFDNQERGPSNV